MFRFEVWLLAADFVLQFSGQDVQKWKWHHDTNWHFCWPLHMEEKYTEDLMYSPPHWTLPKLRKFNHPWEYLTLQRVPGNGGDAEISLWHAVPLQVGQSLAKQHRGRSAQNILRTGELKTWMIFVFSRWRAWRRTGRGAGVSGSPDSENEVMALGLQLSPTALSGPEAPSHLCAVWPAAGSCSLSLYPLMDGSVSLWPHPPSTTTSLRHSVLIPLHPGTDPFSSTSEGLSRHKTAASENKGNTFNYSQPNTV